MNDDTYQYAVNESTWESSSFPEPSSIEIVAWHAQHRRAVDPFLIVLAYVAWVIVIVALRAILL